jgi:hypothetical protein
METLDISRYISTLSTTNCLSTNLLLLYHPLPAEWTKQLPLAPQNLPHLYTP